MSEFFLGLDLGKQNDYTALCLIECTKEIPERGNVRCGVRYADGREVIEPPARPIHRYRTHWVERLPLGTDYPSVLWYVKQRVEMPAIKGKVAVILDHTGGGIPVLDFFREAKLPCPLIGLTITASGKPHWESATEVHVSKRDLIAAAQVCFQCRTLQIAKELPHAATLVHELQTYEVKISDAGHDSYNARQGQHDDLVLALCLAVWLPERRRRAGTWGRD